MTLQFERLSYRFGWLSWLVMLGCVLILTVANFPLQWLTSIVANASNCQLSLSQPAGTIWKGSAQVGFLDGKSAGSKGCQRPQAMSERFSWTSQCSVLGRQCKWLLQYPDAERPLEFTLKPNSLALSSNQIEFPPELIEVLSGPWRSLHLRGKLIVRWTELVWDSSQRGSVEVEFVNASSKISPVKPLGSYRLAFQLNQKISIELSTIEGILQLAGKGNIEMNRLSFQGDAKVRPESLDSLIGLLSIIGKKDGTVYRFKI
jgi:general secretion pathway protein N